MKETNPKEGVGVKKAYTSVIPQPVIYEIGLAFLEGALKYGRHNWRVKGVRASTYKDAAKRHIDRWWEGENNDTDSECHHLVHAIACLMILRDAKIHDKLTDDRPPKTEDRWMEVINLKVERLLEKYPEPEQAYIQGD